MKVVNCAFDDYANMAFTNAKALQSVGINCRAVKRVKHPFGYTQEAEVVSQNKLLSICSDADVVQAFHSWDPGFSLLKKKVRIVMHTGTTYRMNPKANNERFDNLVDITLTNHCEFMKLGAKNLHYLAPATDTNMIKCSDRIPEHPLVIGHYPSNPTVKGTNAISQMISDIYMEGPPGKFIFAHSNKVLPYQEGLKRMAGCDIYIELFAPTQHGREYGNFGITAFEAAAMGKIVLTNNLYEQVYQDAYGDCPFVIVNTEGKFKAAIRHFIGMSANYIRQRQLLARECVHGNHSLQATGKRWLQILQPAAVV